MARTKSHQDFRSLTTVRGRDTRLHQGPAFSEIRSLSVPYRTDIGAASQELSGHQHKISVREVETIRFPTYSQINETA